MPASGLSVTVRTANIAPMPPAAAAATPSLPRSFIWYLVIGGAKTLASYGGYVALVLLGAHPQIALVLTHLAVTILGYPGHARLAFGVVGWGGFGWYFLVANGIYGVNAGLLAAGTAMEIHPLLAQALCQVITVPLGFFAMRGLLRRQTERLVPLQTTPKSAHDLA